MKKLAFALCLCTLMSFGAPLGPDPEAAITMKGEYHWTQRDVKGEIKAVFTPTGEGQWSVEFFFDWRDDAHVYAGTAEGNLKNGALKGSVKNDNKNRTFNFEGKTENGTFKGSHEEIGRSGPRETGTIELMTQ